MPTTFAEAPPAVETETETVVPGTETTVPATETDEAVVTEPETEEEPEGPPTPLDPEELEIGEVNPNQVPSVETEEDQTFPIRVPDVVPAPDIPVHEVDNPNQAEFPQMVPAPGAPPLPVAPTSNPPMTGEALMECVKLNPGLTKRELAVEAGYAKADHKGKMRVNLTGFYDALLDARGISLGGGAASEGGKGRGRGREVTHRATVHKNGQIVIGAAYIEELGVKPSTVFEIKVLPRTQKIELRVIGEGEEEAA